MNIIAMAVLTGVGLFVIVLGIAGVGWYVTNKNKGIPNYKPYKNNKIPTKIKNGGINMDKLEEDVFSEFEGAYNDIVEEIKRAEKDEDGIDLKAFVSSQAKRFVTLNNAFREAKIRMEGK